LKVIDERRFFGHKTMMNVSSSWLSGLSLAAVADEMERSKAAVRFRT
jgi:hypothetical protein